MYRKRVSRLYGVQKLQHFVMMPSHSSSLRIFRFCIGILLLIIGVIMCSGKNALERTAPYINSWLDQSATMISSYRNYAINIWNRKTVRLFIAYLQIYIILCLWYNKNTEAKRTYKKQYSNKIVPTIDRQPDKRSLTPYTTTGGPSFFYINLYFPHALASFFLRWEPLELRPLRKPWLL